MVNALDPDRLTKDDFLKFAKNLVAAMDAREALIAKQFTKLTDRIDNRATTAETRVDKTLNQLTNQIKTRVDAIRDGMDGTPGKDGTNPDPQAIVLDVLKEIQLPEQKEQLLDTPEDIRNKLELLRGEERLDITAIRGIEERLAKLPTTKRLLNNGITGRDIIKNYDLSPKLDGVTKVFAIPGNWTILEVSGTSAPYRFNRLVDYTFTPQQITFASQIDASTSLAAGQTVEILYVSA